MAIARRDWMLGAVAGAAACGRKRRRAPEPDSITVLYPGDETAIGPISDQAAQYLLFLPLVAWNARGELEGRLAERWDHSPDHRTWTIRLRDGIRWHDGAPVTAHDIKFTLDLLTHSVGMWWTPDSFTVNVIDDLTYTITCHRHNVTGTGRDDSTVYYPKHILEKLDPKEFFNWAFWKHPIGNGPYRYVRHLPQTMMRFEANPDYYRGRPKIAHVALKFAGWIDGCVSELLGGTVDAAASVNKRADLGILANDGRFRVYDQLTTDPVRVLYWNHHHPLFRDAHVRKALTVAINRRELLHVIDYPADAPVLDGPLSARQLRRRDFVQPMPFDRELANRLLDEAGWAARNRDGIRLRDGSEFAFTVNCISDFQEAWVVYIAAQLKRIGVRMNIRAIEGLASAKRVATGDYEAALHQMNPGWHVRGGPKAMLAAAGYASHRFLQLVDRMGTVLDPDEEDRIYRELTLLFQEDVPATFLYPDVSTTIASTRVRGLEQSPYRGDLTWCMDELTLAEGS